MIHGKPTKSNQLVIAASFLLTRVSCSRSLCSIIINETNVFDMVPTREDVLLTLKIGAYEPAHFSYVLSDESTGDVQVWLSSPDSQVGSMDTIFSVTDEYGSIAYFKNMKSQIKIGGKDEYTLRNMPTFINLNRIELRDIEVKI